MYFDEDDIGAMVESRTLVLWYGRSELANRSLDEIGRLEADPEMLRLIEVLKNSESWSKRIRAWEKIREMGPSIRGWTQALRDLIFHADGWARIFAAESLACHSCCEAEAVPVLLVTLESTLEMRFYDWSRMACGAIGRYSTLPRPLTDQAVPALLNALDASDANVQGYAAQALGNWGERSRPALVKLADLHDATEDPLRSHYHQILRRIDPSIENSHEARISALNDEDEKVRAGAIASLGRTGPQAASAIPQLLPLSRDESPEVRRNLALALGDLQKNEKSVLHELNSLTADDHPAVQLAAAYACIRLNVDAKHNLARLRRALTAEAEPTRLLAAWALGEVGDRSFWRSRSALKKALRTEDKDKVGATIRQALSKLGG
jgi:HEAT repeat protein